MGDEVVLQWVNTEDLLMINQKLKDLDLVQLVDSVSLAEGGSEEQTIKNKEDNEAVDDLEEGDDAGEDFKEAVDGHTEQDQ